MTFDKKDINQAIAIGILTMLGTFAASEMQKNAWAEYTEVREEKQEQLDQYHASILPQLLQKRAAERAAERAAREESNTVPLNQISASDMDKRMEEMIKREFERD